MSDVTSIEWTEATWNPVTGCDRVSPGCDHCYALTLAARLKAMGAGKYQRDGDPRTSGPGFGVTMHIDAVEIPLRWRAPRRVFVNSMSDLFHQDVTNEFIASVFAVMAATPQHTYQVLTKRHARLRSLVSSERFRGLVLDYLHRWLHRDVLFRCRDEPLDWPLPNVWLGVSVEDQQWADNRIPALLQTPAAVHFLSCEPLLGPVELEQRWLPPTGPRVAWVIAGGESGPVHRPVDLDWVRSLRDQCVTARVPFFFKQVGGRTPKTGGRVLDGRAWDEYPTELGRSVAPSGRPGDDAIRTGETR